MRRLVYDVINADGKYFTTFSYAVAHQAGSRIKKTYLVPCTLEDSTSDEKRAERAEKRRQAIRVKKGGE